MISRYLRKAFWNIVGRLKLQMRKRMWIWVLLITLVMYTISINLGTIIDVFECNGRNWHTSLNEPNYYILELSCVSATNVGPQFMYATSILDLYTLFHCERKMSGRKRKISMNCDTPRKPQSLESSRHPILDLCHCFFSY